MIDSSEHSIHISHSYYTTEMAQWSKNLSDASWVYYAGGMTIHFSREEDLLAFKLRFKV